MANNIDGIVDEIYTIINGTSQFSEINKFAIKDIDVTPSCVIFYKGIESMEFAETVSRWVTYEFWIDMFFSMEEEDDWQDNQKDIPFAVIDAFLDKPDLNMPTYLIRQLAFGSPILSNDVSLEFKNPYAVSRLILLPTCFEEATT